MSIELITGMAETAHISANDYRAINRANYGQGRYILNDDHKMTTEMHDRGMIYIDSGSCLWSGMHIRCEEPTTLTYIMPVTTEDVYVYLHYVKDTETLYESVEWVTSVGKKLSPEIDNLSDNTIEAYTLFCYATITSDGKIGDVVYMFELVKSHEDYEKKYADSQKSVVLYNGLLSVGSCKLSESFKNYKYIIFEVAYTNDASYHTVQFSDMISEHFAINIVGNSKWSNKNSLFVEIFSLDGRIKSDTELTISYITRTMADQSVASYYGSDGIVVPLRIIGREKIVRD